MFKSENLTYNTEEFGFKRSEHDQQWPAERNHGINGDSRRLIGMRVSELKKKSGST